MKVIIAGSREVTEPDGIGLVILAMSKCGWNATEVLSGGCRGIDRSGEAWARHNGIPFTRYYAEWSRWGKGAGPIRNGLMADDADALVAIWDGESRGTKNMIDTMRARGKPVHVQECLRYLPAPCAQGENVG